MGRGRQQAMQGACNLYIALSVGWGRTEVALDTTRQD